MSKTRLYDLKVETMEGERPIIRLGTVRSQTAYRNQFEICYSDLKDCTGLTRAALIDRNPTVKNAMMNVIPIPIKKVKYDATSQKRQNVINCNLSCPIMVSCVRDRTKGISWNIKRLNKRYFHRKRRPNCIF